MRVYNTHPHAILAPPHSPATKTESDAGIVQGCLLVIESMCARHWDVRLRADLDRLRKVRGSGAVGFGDVLAVWGVEGGVHMKR
jgi:hypothetical protein